MPVRSFMTAAARVLVLLVVAVLALAACGSDGGSKPTAQRPDGPAPVGGDFRSDAGSQVANTGRPQLIEFFSYT